MNLYSFIFISAAILILFLLAVFYFYHENNALKIDNYTIKSPKIHKNIRIVHLSDLHYKEFGKDNSILIKLIKEQQPELIIFTGDLIDRRKHYSKSAVKFMGKLAEFAPVYFVYGNQEMAVNFKDVLTKDLMDNGVIVLDREMTVININDQNINILGLNDFTKYKGRAQSDFSESKKILSVFEKKTDFKLLLNHFPQFFDYNSDFSYCDYNIDLVLAGHAHGGQFILPFFGGIYSPGQGLFPKYSAGLYRKNNVSLIVNRSLGNSGFPLRINNLPDVIVIDLKESDDKSRHA
jgi:predicted MPP superfamily phosphohydrolase